MSPDARSGDRQIVASTSTGPEKIQKRQIQRFLKADPAYGTGVAKGLGWDIRDFVAPSGKEGIAAD